MKKEDLDKLLGKEVTFTVKGYGTSSGVLCKGKHFNYGIYSNELDDVFEDDGYGAYGFKYGYEFAARDRKTTIHDLTDEPS